MNLTYNNVSQWGAYLFDINWAYGEIAIVVHSIWSAAIPILLTELLFLHNVLHLICDVLVWSSQISGISLASLWLDSSPERPIHIAHLQSYLARWQWLHSYL